MSDFRRVSAFPRILVLLLLVIVLVFGGLLWFDFIGIIDVKSTLAPVLGPVFNALGIEQRKTPPAPVESPGLLEDARLAKQQQALDQRQADLDKLKQSLDARAAQLDQQEAALQQREKVITDKENSFNQQQQQYENRRANLIKNATYLTNMPPDQAVAILVKYDDQLLIDTLRVTDELAQQAGQQSLVPYWLSKMPPDRAAEIQQKMALKPGG